jgi:hypothetical protein
VPDIVRQAYFVGYVITAADEVQITGPLLRSLREHLGLERSAIAAHMSPAVGRQRIVNIEAQAHVSVGSARRYLDALEQLRPGLLDPPSG